MLNDRPPSNPYDLVLDFRLFPSPIAGPSPFIYQDPFFCRPRKAVFPFASHLRFFISPCTLCSTHCSQGTLPPISLPPPLCLILALPQDLRLSLRCQLPLPQGFLVLRAPLSIFPWTRPPLPRVFPLCSACPLSLHLRRPCAPTF